MSNNMEDILGLGAIDTERKVPGISIIEGREYRYISCDNNDISDLFNKIIREVDPPIVKNGGAIYEGCRLVLPTGETYFAVSYKGDIHGWRQQIERGATALNLSVAKITNERLLLSDGNEVLLSECEVQFD